MFDIGFPELLLVAIVGLLVIGPERLPEALRTLGLWLGRMRRSFTNVKTEIEKEIGMDEIRRQLHNEAVMEEMKRIEREVRNTVNQGTIEPRKPPAGNPAGAPPDDAVAADSAPAEPRPAEPRPAEPLAGAEPHAGDDAASAPGAKDQRHG